MHPRDSSKQATQVVVTRPDDQVWRQTARKCHVNFLVNLCFEPSQPRMIISGLKERKRDIIERTNKAEIRPEEQSEKTESFRQNLWNEIQLKGHRDRNRHKDRI